MRRQKRRGKFIDELREAVDALKEMRPDETRVLSVNASYGRYRIAIGPTAERKAGERKDRRPIEINGEIHHLFVSPNSVKALPSKRQMHDNLKDTVVMRNLSVHIRDPKGDGRHMDDAISDAEALSAKECINLAGSDGERLLEESGRGRRLHMATYRIVQRDILQALKSRAEEETTDASEQ